MPSMPRFARSASATTQQSSAPGGRRPSTSSPWPSTASTYGRARRAPDRTNAKIPSMLLTISTTHRPATDLGYLLGKHPERIHTKELGFGIAHVYYPEAGDERCTAALLLDVDPVGLVRRPRGAEEFALSQYTNDRPYVAS